MQCSEIAFLLNSENHFLLTSYSEASDTMQHAFVFLLNSENHFLLTSYSEASGKR